jgi:hypothetical protein
MDHHVASVVEVKHDEFEHVAGRVGAEHQCAGGGGVVVEVGDESSVVEGVEDLAIGDAVLRADRWISTSRFNRNTKPESRQRVRERITAHGSRPLQGLSPRRHRLADSSSGPGGGGH